MTACTTGTAPGRRSAVFLAAPCVAPAWPEVRAGDWAPSAPWARSSRTSSAGSVGDPLHSAPPPTEHPGRCPRAEPCWDPRHRRSNQCLDDSVCRRDEKCCNTGCTWACVAVPRGSGEQLGSGEQPPSLGTAGDCERLCLQRVVVVPPDSVRRSVRVMHSALRESGAPAWAVAVSAWTSLGVSTIPKCLSTI